MRSNPFFEEQKVTAFYPQSNFLSQLEKQLPPPQPKKKSQKSQKSKISTTTTTNTAGSSAKTQNENHNQQNFDESSFATNLIHKLEQADVESKMKLLKEKVVLLACTQSGSRHLQKEIAKADSSFVEFMLKDIGRKLSVIMVDRYGNYFCQKLLQNCTINQRSNVLQLIRTDFTKICCD